MDTATRLAPMVEVLEPAAPTYRSLLRQREYAGLLVSRGISLVGDQIARVALTVLVYERTGSALLSAIAYLATDLPACLGPLVSGVADRWPRRRVLLVCDLARAALLAVMAVRGMPWVALVVLIGVTTILESPWQAARVPLIRSILPDERMFRLGAGLDDMVEQPGFTLGYLVAGALLVAAGPRTALLIDAASFAASALVVRALVRPGSPASAPRVPRPAGVAAAARLGVADARVGLRATLAPLARRPILLCWVAASAIIGPVALIAPWADQLHAGGTGIGLLLAAPTVGCFAALPFVSRLSGRSAERATVPLALLALLPLGLCAFHLSMALALTALVACGAGSSFTVLTRVSFLRHVPDEVAGRAYSVASAVLFAVRGGCLVLAGLLGDRLGAGRGIAVLAIGAAVIVGLIALCSSPEPSSELFIDDEPPLAIDLTDRMVSGEPVAVG